MSPQTSDGNPHTPTTKSLAVPAPGRKPTFDEVANIALVSAANCDQSVCVICLSQEVLECWMCRLLEFPAPVTRLDMLNTNRATLNDWKAFLSNQTYALLFYTASSLNCVPSIFLADMSRRLYMPCPRV